MDQTQLCTDSNLVERAQRGEREAFDALVAKYQHQLMRIVARYISDWSECHDVVQDTFVRAYRALGQYRQEAQFSTWLYRIAVNTAKNHLAAQNSRLHAATSLDLTETPESIGLIKPDEATPERELMRQELEHALLAALERLPQDLRQTIVAREIEGASYEEIAQRMQCPVGTVRSRLFRAREAIDAQLRCLLEQPLF